jgi:RNA polymerase sigma-70 factor, ECF subfamily
MREIVEEYMEAMRGGDVNRVVSMLAAEAAAWSMPPLASWYGGLAEIEVFLRRGPLSGDWALAPRPHPRQRRARGRHLHLDRG